MRHLRLQFAFCAAVALAAMLWTGAAARAAESAAELANRLVAAKLTEVEIMVACKWWTRADRDLAQLDSLIKANRIDNPIVLKRLEAARLAVDNEMARRSAEPEARRFTAVLARLKSGIRRFPDTYTVIRVRPDGSGDARTLGEALAKSGEYDLIELATGVYELKLEDLSGRSAGRDKRGRTAPAIFAGPGQWPRIVPEKDAEFAIDQDRWLDGVEVIAGRNAVARGRVHARNCTFRVENPPTDLDKGPSGLVHGEPDAADCVFQNFIVALAPPRDRPVANNLFITSVNAVRLDRHEVRLDGCAFYRCINVAWGDRGSATGCVFCRCKQLLRDDRRKKNEPPANDAMVLRDCTAAEDPFADPFRGDFRLRDATAGRPAPGPQWPTARWEMFAANYNRPLSQPPLGLGEARDAAAAKALEAIRQSVRIGDARVAGEQLGELFNRYGQCPVVQRNAAEIDKLAGEVLAELVKQAQPGGVDDNKQRALAQEYYNQAAAASADKPAEALRLARLAVDRDAGHPDAHLLLGELLLDAGRPAQAGPVVQRAGDLLEAHADKVSPATRARLVQLQGRLARLGRFAQDWDKLRREQVDRYVAALGPPGSPSTAFGYRRALLLDPDNDRYKSKLAEAEKMLRPLDDPPADAPDVNTARQRRIESDKQLAARQYTKAIELRREAYSHEPTPEDLLFLARCYQRSLQPGQAATLALQARQTAGPLDGDRGRNVLYSALELLRTVDPVQLRLETMDQDFVRAAELKVRQASSAGDKDTAEAITAALAALAKVDRLKLTHTPPPPTTQAPPPTTQGEGR